MYKDNPKEADNVHINLKNYEDGKIDFNKISFSKMHQDLMCNYFAKTPSQNFDLQRLPLIIGVMYKEILELKIKIENLEKQSKSIQEEITDKPIDMATIMSTPLENTITIPNHKEKHRRRKTK